MIIQYHFSFSAIKAADTKSNNYMGHMEPAQANQ